MTDAATNSPDDVSILVVDDEPKNLFAIQAVLNGLGGRLVTARSGPEALRHLLNRDFAVILLDVQMPDLDGFQTAAIIRDRDRCRHVPIIFITAISKASEHVRLGYSLGARLALRRRATALLEFSHPQFEYGCPRSRFGDLEWQ